MAWRPIIAGGSVAFALASYSRAADLEFGSGLRFAAVTLAIGSAFHLDRVQRELEAPTATGLRMTLLIRSLATLALTMVMWVGLVAIADPSVLGLGITLEAATFVVAGWAGAVWMSRFEARSAGIVGAIVVLLVAGAALAVDDRYRMFPISVHVEGYPASRVRWAAILGAVLTVGSVGLLRTRTESR